MKLADIRSMDGKVRPVIAGEIAAYVREMTHYGIWGKTPSEVARTLVREGVMSAISRGMIKLREKKERRK